MAWDKDAFAARLAAAVSSFDRATSEALCRDLAKHVIESKEPYPAAAARRILQLLRNKRYFDLLGRTADLFIQSGQCAPVVRRQYAQALLDQGQMTAGLHVLEKLVADTRRDRAENAEAVGLQGRAHKQLFVNARQDHSPWSRGHLDSAIRLYLAAYGKEPKTNFWHGVNVVALLSRAARAGLRRPARTPNPRTLAAELLRSLEAKRDKGELSAWDHASGAEATLALGKPVEVVAAWLVPYARNPGADAFELGSTLRQLEEVWQLDERTSPGDLLLPLLRGELLRREGGAATLDARALGATQRATGPQLESILGTEGVSTLEWYRTGERRCHNVARIDSRFRPEGTGFLVRGSDLADRLGDEVLLVTNAHVVAESPAAGALPPDGATARFFARAGETTPAAHAVEQVWSSPRDQLDATLLRLSPRVPIEEPYPIAPRLPPKGPPAERVYVIGHPGGRELSISLQDNELLDHNHRLIHYRAPTEQGSSGSPVFDADWELIGLHHSGGAQMDRLDGSGKYAANEGISIEAIRGALSRGALPRARR